MSFNDFIHKYNLKIKTTSSIEFYQVLSSIGLDNADVYLRNGPFLSDVGIVNLLISKRTLWVEYKNEHFFVSYDCAPP